MARRAPSPSAFPSLIQSSRQSNPTDDRIAQPAASEGGWGSIDKAIQNSYDNLNTTGGDNNGTRPFDPGTQTDRATTEGFESIIPKTSTEIANRFSVHTGLGANAETSPHIRADERQRTGLNSQNERFPPHSYIQVPIGSPIRDNQEIFRNSGIECRIVDPAYWDKDGMAFTNTEIVYVNPNIDRGNNVSALGIVHIDELLQTSRYDKSTDEHNHQWMDENGWELRKTYIQESDGTIYEATLNIANGRDRRILYAISNVRQIDKGGVARGDVPSTVSGRGSLTKSNSSNETIADSEHDVKQRFSMDDAVGEEHLRPEDLKDVPMYQPKPKSPYRADSERAIDTRLVSDAEAHAPEA